MSKGNKHSHPPPRLATNFLHWYCQKDLVDEVEGDLYELFQRRVEQSLWKAKELYWLNVLMFLHADYIQKRNKNYTSNHTDIFRNYFTIALRNLNKHNSFAVINITGLTLLEGKVGIKKLLYTGQCREQVFFLTS